jgi:hypothetical protein
MGKKRGVKTIGDGTVGNIDPDPKPYGSDLTWAVVIDEALELKQGTRIVIYRNTVGILSLTVSEPE